MAREHDGSVWLPDDIVFDMLTRVPAKALCRFRCVCKRWRALISDAAFIAVQRSRAGPHLVGVFYRAWPPEVRVMDMDGNVVRVLEVRQLGKDDDGSDVLLGVMRQATATTPTRLDLICVQHTGPTGTFASDAMIIDPVAGRACAVGMDMPCFGGTAPSGAFKVICLQDTLPPSQICKVAAILDGGVDKPLTWRQGSAPTFLTSWNPEQRTTVNGVAYIMACVNMHGDAALNSGSGRIAAFDLESEEWKITNGPAFGVEDETEYLTLTELRGTLGLVQNLRNDDRRYAIIWLLVDFDKIVWVKEYTIQMPKQWGFPKQLGALDDGRILLLVSEWEKGGRTKDSNKISYHHHRDVLVFYNLSTKTFTELTDKVTMGFHDIFVLYTGSLLS